MHPKSFVGFHREKLLLSILSQETQEKEQFVFSGSAHTAGINSTLSSYANPKTVIPTTNTKIPFFKFEEHNTWNTFS